MAQLQNPEINPTNAQTQTKPAGNTKLSKAIEAANELVAPLILPENSAYALDPLLKVRFTEYILEPNEKIIFITKQSKLGNPIPSLVAFTDKKIVMGKPSILHFLGIKSLAFKAADLIKYTEIRDLSIKRGMYLRSVFVKIPGAEPVEINGMKSNDADLILKFVMKILEYLEG
jgi:hypothetical protein